MATSSSHLFVVILAGGGGTRLWPRSTASKPKQFLRLLSDKTLLQETYDRIRPLVPPERVIVVTNHRYEHETKETLPEVPAENIIAEPAKKDTAMAMGVGAVVAHHRDSDAVIINMAADNAVTDKKEFRDTMMAAVSAAQLWDYLLTVGVHPTYPHTGLGYIRVKDEFKRVDGYHVFTVSNFAEKPMLAKARAFLATGKYFWNANNYVWTAHSALSAFQKYLPKTYEQLESIRHALALGTAEFKRAMEKSYGSVEAISVDYGVSEKASNLLLIPGDFGWNDVGDWNVVYSLSKQDLQKNVVDQSRVAPPVFIDTNGCFISGGKKLLATIGLQDMIIIETKKALLVAPRARSQDVKKLVEHLKEQHLDDYL